jgi:GTP-binding protein EngB required for normal cell division
MAGMSFMNKSDKAPKEKKEKKVKAPKEKKEKAPKDPNAPEKNFLGREKKVPRAELQAEIDRLNQELAYKSGELNAMKQWARSAPVR